MFIVHDNYNLCHGRADSVVFFTATNSPQELSTHQSMPRVTCNDYVLYLACFEGPAAKAKASSLVYAHFTTLITNSLIGHVSFTLNLSVFSCMQCSFRVQRIRLSGTACHWVDHKVHSWHQASVHRNPPNGCAWSQKNQV